MSPNRNSLECMRKTHSSVCDPAHSTHATQFVTVVVPKEHFGAFASRCGLYFHLDLVRPFIYGEMVYQSVKNVKFGVIQHCWWNCWILPRFESHSAGLWSKREVNAFGHFSDGFFRKPLNLQSWRDLISVRPTHLRLVIPRANPCLQCLCFLVRFVRLFSSLFSRAELSQNNNNSSTGKCWH